MQLINNYIGFLPLIITALISVLSLLLRRLLKDSISEKIIPAANVLGLCSAAAAYYPLFERLKASGPIQYWDGVFCTDALACFLGPVIMLLSALALFISSSVFLKESQDKSMQAVLISISASGACLACSSKELLTCFFALEVMSLPLCITELSSRHGKEEDRKSGIACALKLFLSHSAASAIMLYGISLFFGTAGSTFLQSAVDNYISFDGSSAPRYAFIIGTMFIFTGLASKLGAAPFNILNIKSFDKASCALDIYASSAVKAALSGVMLRFIWQGFAVQSQDFRLADTWIIILGIFGILSILTGSYKAYKASDYREFTAASDMVQTGLLFMAVLSGAKSLAFEEGTASALTAIVVFACAGLVFRSTLTAAYKNSTSDKNYADLFSLLCAAAAGIIWMDILPYAHSGAEHALKSVWESQNYGYMAAASACGMLIYAAALIKFIKHSYTDKTIQEAKVPLSVKAADLLLIAAAAAAAYCPQFFNAVLYAGQNLTRP